jgi:hypothetical protein
VLLEKQEYDYERDQLERWKHKQDMERGILFAEFIRAEELEHELEHRNKMLEMLKYNKE